MMMEKDYQLIAGAINDVFYQRELQGFNCSSLFSLLRILPPRLKEDNPKFDSDKFITACLKDGGKNETTKKSD